MSTDQRIRQSQHLPYFPNLIFEEFTQGLDKLQGHHVRKPPHVMVAFDRRGRSFERHALNHIGIKGPLRQEGNPFNLFRLVDEHVDEGLPDNLTLFFRIGYPL